MLRSKLFRNFAVRLISSGKKGRRARPQRNVLLVAALESRKLLHGTGEDHDDDHDHDITCAAESQEYSAFLMNQGSQSGQFIANYDTAAAPSAWTGGDKNVLLIRIDFSDRAGDPVSFADANAALQMTSDFFYDSSYGQFGFGDWDVTPTYRMPRASNSNEYSRINAFPNIPDPTEWLTNITNDALAAARNANVDPDAYWSWGILFPTLPQFSWGGLGSLGGPNTWYNGWQGSVANFGAVLGHEFGHNLGANHSVFLNSQDGDPLSTDDHPGGNPIEYGDLYSVMGAAYGTYPKAQFPTIHKAQFGWLESTNIATTSNDGVFRIYAQDANEAGYLANRTYALQVPLANGKANYWFELRNSFATNIDSVGLEVRLDDGWTDYLFYPNKGNSTLLINTEGQGTYTDAPLDRGDTYTDPSTFAISYVSSGIDTDGQWFVEVSLDVFADTTTPVKPVVTEFDGEVIHTPGQSELIDDDAFVLDIGAETYNGGEVRLEFTSGADINNRLSILSVGTGVGQISVLGTSVRYGGVEIGTITSNGVGTNALVIALNDMSNKDNVQALVRSLQFSNATPSQVVRTVQLTVRDGAAAGTGLASDPVTKNINVLPTVDNFSDVLNHVPGTVVYVDQDAILYDEFNEVFTGGQLYAEFTSGADTNNVLAIRNAGNGPNQFSVTSGTVRYGNVVIGTVTGGDGTNPLVVTFNSAATKVAVQALVRNLTYTNSAPLAVARTLSVTISDGPAGTGLVGPTATKLINTTRVVRNFDGTLTVGPGITAYLDQDTTTIGGNNTDFRGGQIRLEQTSPVDVNAVLSIRSVGNGPGQLALLHPELRYSGVAVATVSGGTNGNPLVVTFNNNVTLAAVQAILRNFTYLNPNPTYSKTTLRLTLTDNAGLTTSPVTKAVNIPPRVDAFNNPLAYVGSKPAYIDQDAIVVGGNALYNGGYLELGYAFGGGVNDRLSIRSAGRGSNQFLIEGSNLLFENRLIGTISGGTGTTALRVNFTGNTARRAVQALVRNLTYQSTVATTGTKALTLTIRDGATGLTSSPVNKTISLAIA